MSDLDTNSGELVTAQAGVGATHLNAPSMSRRTTVMIVGTTLSRLTGFVRIQLLAAALGIGFLSDAYVLGNNTPNIIYELVVGGVLSATLVPVFVSLNNKSDDDLSDGSSAIIGVAFAILAVVTVLFIIFAPILIHAFTLRNNKPLIDERRDVASYLMIFFAPQLLIYGFVTIATALLNTKRRFAAPMFAPIVNNMIVIFMFISFMVFFDPKGPRQIQDDRSMLMFLGIFTTMGVFGMALALIPSIKRAHISMRPRWQPRHPAVSRVIRLSGWTLGFVAANQVALAAVLSLASRQNGGVAAYTLAYVFFLLPHGIVSVSIMTGYQPEIADAWQKRDLAKFRHNISTGMRLILLVTIPAAIGYVLLAEPISLIALHHGAAHKDSVLLVSDVLRFMAVGLPAFSIYLFFISCFQGMQNTKTAFKLYVVENGINITAAIYLYNRYHLKGLGFAFALAYTVAAIAAFIVLSRSSGSFFKEILNSLWRMAIAAVALIAVVEGVVRYCENSSQPPLIVLAAAVVLGAPTYFFVGKLVRMPEWNILMRGPLARFAQRSAQ